jgi:hypothetical protein
VGRERTQQIEIDLRSGIVSNESLLTIGGLRPPGPSGLPMVGLYRAQNAVWDYRYPRVTSGGVPWPRMLQHPIMFASDTAKTYTGSKSFRDIGYTYNSNYVSSPAYLVAMGADSSDVYTCWPAAGGSAIAFDSGVGTFTISASTKRPGCSAYWDTPGNYPTGAVDCGTIGLDYDAATNTITRASGSFVTDGFVTGRTITVTKSTRNDGTYTLTNVAALVLTVSESLVDETAGTSLATQDATSTKGVLVFSHREGDEVYYLMDDATVIGSLTDDVTNCPAGAHALTIHLDRLWLANKPSVSGGQYSYVYYTDPLNLASIRTTNVIKVDGTVMCLIPGQFGAIDVSGVPHLLIGTDQGLWCLDGDPQLGGGLQANLRQLTNGVGIPSPLAATVTPYGVFFLGTDGNLWNVPPGCQSVGMVGDPIRDVLGINNVTLAVDSLAANKPTGSVVWFEPYLYIFPGGETTYAFVAEPSQNGLKFWGPQTLTSSITSREAIVKAPRVSSLYTGSGSSKEGAHLVHSIDVTPSTSAARFLAFDEFVTQTGSYPNGSSVGRPAYVQTGLINVPGHRVQATRVILETLRIPLTSVGTTPVWTVIVTDDRGNTRSGVLTPEPAVTTGTYARFDVATQHFAIPALTAARGVSVKISVTTEAGLSLQRAIVELHISPAQF